MAKSTDREAARGEVAARQTWNSAAQIAEHRAMTPEQRLRKMISLSQAALRFSRAERVDGHDNRFEPDEILAARNEHGVRYVVVGGFAVAAHGVVRATADLNLVVQLDRDNAASLAAALAAIRGRDLDDNPSAIDQESLVRRADRRLRTQHGEVHLLNEVDSVPLYEELVPATVAELGGQRVPVAQLADLKAMKGASGRAKDGVDLAELRRPRPRLAQHFPGRPMRQRHDRDHRVHARRRRERRGVPDPHA